MVDKELAVKLAKRFDKLNFDTYDRTDGTEVPQQTIIPKQSAPPPPPPPSLPPLERQQTPPFQIVPENEWADMDKLIGQTLRNLEVTSPKTSNTMLTSINYVPEPRFKKPLVSMNVTDTLPEGIFYIFILKQFY